LGGGKSSGQEVSPAFGMWSCKMHERETRLPLLRKSRSRRERFEEGKNSNQNSMKWGGPEGGPN